MLPNRRLQPLLEYVRQAESSEQCGRNTFRGVGPLLILAR
ncbi:MAG: hypothetical protein ACI8PT_002995 [Gammaproteobacteria bacterium]|jgi:hypothetical protein